MPTPQRVADLAYHLWIERGRPHGSAEEDWVEAERQVAQQERPHPSREARMDDRGPRKSTQGKRSGGKRSNPDDPPPRRGILLPRG